MARGSPERAVRRGWWVLWGWTGGVVGFLYLPIFLLVVYSFNASKLSVRWGGFTWGWYGAVWRDRVLLGALENTVIVAVAATALSVPLGTLGAWILYRYRVPWRRAVSTIVYVPMIMPEVVMGVSLMIFFVAVAGVGNAWIGRLRGEEGELGLGFVTVIVAHVTFCFPFVMAAVRARLSGLDPSLEEAAMDLGASPGRAFFSVIVPFLWPAIVSGGLMAFTLSMDELIVSYFTVGPGAETLPIKIFGMARVGLSPVLNALSTIFLVGTAVFVVVGEWVKKRGGRNAECRFANAE